MRVKTIILFLIISTHSIAQDPIFSQADLNMLYVNPAYTGFSSSLEYQNRCFAHNRIQWNKKNQYRKDLNTSYFEINLLPFKKQYSYAKVKNGETAVGLGLHVISQNILLNRMFENTEVGLSLSSINRLAKRWVGVGAMQANYYQR